MTTPVQDLLKKIGYIEAEIEIQKQILYSVPATDRDEIERVLKIIAKSKEDIQILRDEIERTDPEEFHRLVRIEKSVSAFKILTSEKTFSTIENMSIDKECILNCHDGRTIKCLVKACCENGDWTLISTEGELLTLPAKEVVTDR